MREHLLGIAANGRLVLAALPRDRDRRLAVGLTHEVLGEGRMRFDVAFAPNDAAPYVATFDVTSPFPLEAPATNDGALLAALWPALLRGGTLHVEGTISRRLLRNMRELQAIWVRARPDLCRPFAVTADEVVADVPRAAEDQALLPLTGGVDSMLTLCQHTDPTRPLGEATHRVGAALFMPGFSPRMARRAEFPAAIAGVRSLADTRGLPLVVVETDWLDHVGHGILSHGSLLAAVPTLLSRHFRSALIGSSSAHISPSRPYSGSAPDIDPYHSSGALDVYSDVNDMTRGDKLLALSHYPEMLDRIAVCFEGFGMVANCCHCAKCTRTMLDLVARGRAVPPGAFPAGIDPRAVGKRMRSLDVQSLAACTLEAAADWGVEVPDMRRLRWRRYSGLARHYLRCAATRFVPGVDFFRGEPCISLWLAEQRARARERAAGI